MSPATRKQAGILIVILPTVIYGGVSILRFLINDPRYMQNPLRQDLFRAGHAHAGVLLILSFVALLYIGETNLSGAWKRVVTIFIPSAAILLPAAFFFSVLKPDAVQPNGFIYLAYAGAALMPVSHRLGYRITNNLNTHTGVRPLFIKQISYNNYS